MALLHKIVMRFEYNNLCKSFEIAVRIALQIAVQMLRSIATVAHLFLKYFQDMCIHSKY